MHIPTHLVRREEGSSNTSPILIGITAAVGTFFISVAVYVWWYKRRPPSYKTPSHQPSTPSRWSPINLVHLGRRNRTRNASRRPSDEETSYRATRSTTNNTQMTTTTTANTANNTGSPSVNRNTPGNRGSVRSILTLPAYQPAPAQDERLIAREGERAGVDTVIEFPETAEEEEARREEDMDSLFRIRQLRRAEIDARNERRRLRAEAREQGDWARVEQLRLDAQRRARARAGSGASAGSNGSGGEGGGNNNNNGSSTTTLALPESSREAIAEHHARASSRDQRISSVSYADLGLARHDGSRLRADSVDSDHRPLLGSAASIAGSTTTAPGANRARGDSGASARNESHPRRTSRFRLPVFSPHHGRQHSRAASAESVVSSNVSEDGSNTALELTPTTSSTDRRDNGNPHPVPFIVTPESTTGSNSNSNDTPGSSGSNNARDSPDPPPPDYDSPPDYTSPTVDNTDEGGPPRLPSVRVQTGGIELPEIQVVESTPIP